MKGSDIKQDAFRLNGKPGQTKIQTSGSIYEDGKPGIDIVELKVKHRLRAPYTRPSYDGRILF